MAGGLVGQSGAVEWGPAKEPVFTFIGGGAAVGAAVFSTFALSFSDEPDYGHAAGQGTVAGPVRRPPTTR